MREWSPSRAAEMLTLTFSLRLGPRKGKEEKKVQTCHRDRSRSMSTNTVSKQTQPQTHKLALAQPKQC